MDKTLDRRDKRRGDHDHHRHHQQHPHQPDAGDHGGHSGHGGHDHGEMVADFRRRFWISLLLTPPVLLLSPMIQHWLGIDGTLDFPGSELLLFALSTVVYVYGGWPFLTGFTSELRAGKPGMMTLIALAISVAYIYSAAVTFGLPGMSFYWELVTLIVIMLLGHWLEMCSVMGASRALEELVRLLPDTAARLDASGGVTEVPISELVPGDRVLIRPGAKVPVDGAIIEGRSSFNEAMLTGESRPVSKEKGDRAIGGAINGANAVTIEVTATGDKTYLAQVISLVREAQATRSRTQDVANRAAGWLTYIALAVGLGSLASGSSQARAGSSRSSAWSRSWSSRVRTRSGWPCPLSSRSALRSAREAASLSAIAPRSSAPATLTRSSSTRPGR